MKNKTALIAIASIVLLFGFLFAVYKLTSSPTDYKDVMVLTPGDHTTWSPAKKHVLVEYSDFQCPACKAFHDLFASFTASSSANADIPKKVTLVFRHFPLYQIHQNAFELAYGVEAAGRQGKFFPMADAVFKDQAKIENIDNVNDFLLAKAKEVGLNIDQFNKDRASKSVQDKVKADLASGERAGIDSTPTFFLDGQKLDIQSVPDFINMLKSLD